MIFSGQASTFLLTVALGFALGIFYDIFRILRQAFGPRVIFGAIWDLGFWLAVTLALFFVLLHLNFGELRFYIFLGLAIGVALHLCSLSRLIMRAATVAKKGLRRGARCVRMKGSKIANEVRCFGAKAFKSKKRFKKKAN